MSNKYNARRTFSALCGRFFASQAEAQRGEGLALLEKAGEISNLQYQAKFVLSREPRVSITVDFFYIDNGVEVLEDTKGVLTRDFRTKLAWLKEKYGINVLLTGRNRQSLIIKEGHNG